METRRRRYAVVSATAAAFAALAFFALAVDHTVYAPGARAIQQKIASTDNYTTFLNSPLLASLIYFGIRKTYGAVAFAIVGFLAAPIFARGRRVLATALLLGGLRFAMEIVERAMYHGDGNLESAFDIATGACAGAVGALACNALARRRRPQA